MKLMAGVILVCTAVSAISPGLDLVDRSTALAGVSIATLMTYGIFKAIFGAIVARGETLSGRIQSRFMVFVIYFSALAVPLGILSLPFKWRQLATEGSIPMYLASISCALAMAIAAAMALHRSQVEVRADN